LLTLTAGLVALLCLGGVGAFVTLYDDATKIDRSAPDVAVDNYLRAYLVNRDDTQAALFSCQSKEGLSPMSELREELVRRERDFDVKVNVTWSSLTVTEVGAARREVNTGLTIAGSANGQPRSRRTEGWAFDVVDEGGWRVCGATKVS
jgi:hypothetical protein